MIYVGYSLFSIKYNVYNMKANLVVKDFLRSVLRNDECWIRNIMRFDFQTEIDELLDKAHHLKNRILPYSHS